MSATPHEAPAEPVRVPPETRPVDSEVTAESSDEARVTVQYSDDAPVLVRGTASGRLYTFSPARPARSVAAADAPQLLRHPNFRRSDTDKALT